MDVDPISMARNEKPVIARAFDNLRKQVSVLQEQQKSLSIMLAPIIGPSRNVDTESDMDVSTPEKSEFARGLDEVTSMIVSVRQDIVRLIDCIEI